LSPEPDENNPAALKLETYLESLRTNPPQPDADLAPGIVRRARWQRTIRAPLRAAGTLVAALVDGVTILLGSGRRTRIFPSSRARRSRPSSLLTGLRSTATGSASSSSGSSIASGRRRTAALTAALWVICSSQARKAPSPRKSA
jgi:hypothetical protein